MRIGILYHISRNKYAPSLRLFGYYGTFFNGLKSVVNRSSSEPMALFFQTRKDVPGLSYDIVKAHGGELKVETKEGEGSTFIIQLSK